MKFKYYSFLASAVLMLAAACTPDDHDLSAPELPTTSWKAKPTRSKSIRPPTKSL